MLPFVILALLVGPASAEDTALNVCKAQRNQALEWHMLAEAERVKLLEELEKLRAELTKSKEKPDAK